MTDKVPTFEIPTNVSIESLLPTNLDLDDKQLLKFYRRAFELELDRANKMAEVVVALRQKEHDRDRDLSFLGKVGTGIGAVLLASMGYLLAQLPKWITGHS